MQVSKSRVGADIVGGGYPGVRSVIVGADGIGCGRVLLGDSILGQGWVSPGWTSLGGG